MRSSVTDALFARTVVVPPPAPVSDRRSPLSVAEEDVPVEVVGSRDGFGPLRFREVQAELPHASSGAATSGGLRAEDMTAERMRDIVSALETDAAQP
jgi:hypothetical protein